jgi:Xaa-Pro aminopeptidase
VSPRSKTIAEAGMVITVEPGIYVPDVGGVRIEDSVLVTDDGCQVLTKIPKTYRKILLN